MSNPAVAAELRGGGVLAGRRRRVFAYARPAAAGAHLLRRVLTSLVFGLALAGSGLAVQASSASAVEDRILFVKGNNPAPGESVYLANANGTNAQLVPIQTEVGPIPSDAALSPNGQLISWVRPSGQKLYKYQIMLGSPDGSNQRVLLTSGENELVVEPSFDPTGTKIIYICGKSPAEYVCVVNTDGTNQKQIVATTGGPGQRAGSSPDGTQIVYINEVKEGGALHGQVFVANADGSGVKQVTKYKKPVYYAEDPEFGPNGQIAFSSVNNEGHVVGLTIHTDGTNLHELASCGEPRWLASGSQVTCGAVVEGKCAFKTMNQDGSGAVTYVVNPALSCVGIPGAFFRQQSTSVSTFDYLSGSFEPVLRLDSSERWRPLNIEKFFEEKRQTLCDTNTGCEREPLSSWSGLNADRATTAYVKVAGERDEPNSYHSPYSECTVNGLLDCDAGSRSAIYYRSPGVYGGYEYIDYWFFYRLNYYAESIDFHEGDWEGVTVAPSIATNGFDYAAFSQHGTFFSYARGVLRCEDDPAGSIPAPGTCTSNSRRIDDMVAKGSHANFTTPCKEELATSCRNNNGEIWDEYERGYDGERRWGNAYEPSALFLMPKVGISSWVDWPGKWGSPKQVEVEGEGPKSPANQIFKVACASINNEPGCETGPRTSSVNGPFRLLDGGTVPAAGLTAISCSNWVGAGVSAVACNPRELRAAVLSGRAGASSDLHVQATGERGATGGGHGIAQLLCPRGAVRSGAQIELSGRITRETEVLLHVYDPVRRRMVIARFIAGVPSVGASIARRRERRLRLIIERTHGGVTLTLGGRPALSTTTG
jgi:Tol biopolymer transport system component